MTAAPSLNRGASAEVGDVFIPYDLPDQQHGFADHTRTPGAPFE